MRERCDTTEITATLEKLHTELDVAAEMMWIQITFNVQMAPAQAVYQR